MSTAVRTDADATGGWMQRSHRALVTELDWLRSLLRDHLAARNPPDRPLLTAARATQSVGPGPPPAGSALHRLAASLELTPFERSALVLCAAPSVDQEMRYLLERVTGHGHVTFELMAALLPGTGPLAGAPDGALRHWLLVRPADATPAGWGAVTIDEPVLWYLLGGGYTDQRVADVAAPPDSATVLPGEFQSYAYQVHECWERGAVVLLDGGQHDDLVAVVAAAAACGRRPLSVLDSTALPPEPAQRRVLYRLMERSSALTDTAWLVDGTEPPPALMSARLPLAALDAVGPTTGRAERISVPRLSIAARRRLIHAAADALAVPAPGPALDAIADTFDLPARGYVDVVTDIAAGRDAWAAARSRARARDLGLFDVIEPWASWDDLVLPDTQRAQLAMLAQVPQHRARLAEWGFAARAGRAYGAAAMFCGPSGSGKTLAAEVIAGELHVDLLKVELSRVVDKYIGQTEKNLGRVFDAAENSGAVLLFDEADTLFARRTDVRDAHDRYANLQVGYLLQRVESYRGLTILTTNARGVVDPAVLRRLQAVVVFPHPDAGARAQLWRRAFPPRTPVDWGQLDAMARMDLSGGEIASAAVTAAFLAAADGSTVTLEHITTAVRWESAKTGRPGPMKP